MTITRHIKSLIPPLSSTLHKGQAGRVAVIGGSYFYTGAPYYSGLSSLKTGADLSFVLCTRSAAIPLKSYSPELMVAPILPEMDDEGNMSYFDSVLGRVHSVVIGTGLGRDKSTMEACKVLIAKIRDKALPLVVDGDALHLVASNLDLIRGYEKCILTPNPPEFKKLFDGVFGEGSFDKEYVSKSKEELLLELSKRLGNVTIVQKGEVDLISNGKVARVLEARIENPSPRRTGGQGDVLTGMLAVFAFWSQSAAREEKYPQWTEEISSASSSDKELYNIALGCQAACCLLKRSAQMGFSKHGRSLTTPQIIDFIGEAFEDEFGRASEETSILQDTLF